ncbi:MAG: hypothetical protein E7529_03430 [Ruminococcaceae bacterium]|nr:hypothetical protein [Oscillospiraceae bacterium]
MKWLKNKAVHSKNATRKKNNGGMTYIELLVALSLLVLVVTVFSPMLLRSYDSLYQAGEKTGEAYNSRLEIEDELASRQDDTILNVGTAFKTNGATLINTINVKARQIVSAASGLETLYSGGKGVIKIVSDTLVKDNQSAHSVRLRLTNLDFDEYVILKTADEFEAIKNDKTKLEGKVVFYITSIFDTVTPLNAKVVNKPNFEAGKNYFPFVDIILEDIDITYSPIQFSAYYINDFGTMKVAQAYLTITEADMIFVGKTDGNADYFTLSDAGTLESPVVAGRVMYTAPIDTNVTLTDVSYNPASSALSEGFYAMCGENGIARRLWHLDTSMLAKVKELDNTAVNESDTSKVSEPEIIYKSMSLGGATPYFQYDWAGDLNDLLAFTSSTNSSSVIDYGTSSTADQDFGNGDYVWKNEYNVDENYYAYNFDGFNANHGSFKDNHRRISYVLETTKENLAKKYGVAPKDGYIIRKYNKDGYDHNGRGDDADKHYVFRFENGIVKWYTFETAYNWDWDRTYRVDSVSYKWDGLVSGFSDGKNIQVSNGLVVSRDSAAEGNSWASNENASYTSGDHKLAYVYLKSYNTISPGTLVSNSLTQANTATSKNAAKVNFTSCSALPGTIESFYLGTLEANAIINETKGVVAAPGNSGYSTDEGLVQSWVLVQDGPTNYRNIYDQKALIDVGAALANGGNLRGLISPDSAYGRNQYRTAYNGNNNVHSTWGLQDSNARFTMGYCSDLYAMYESLAVRDMKPLEKVYMGTYSAADSGDSDGDFRHNLWFPREFLNITDSDTYGEAMLAVGYDVGGASKLYYDYSPEVTTSTDTKYLNGTRDMDLNNDGTVDWLEGDGLFTETDIGTSANKGLIYSPFTYGGYKHYIIDPAPGEGEGSQTMLALPKHIVTSTVLDAVYNNGVISVYNPATECFVHIGYIKGTKDENIRLNCVSVDMFIRDEAAGTGILGAAFGGSNGKVYFAVLGYDANGMIGEAPLKWGSTLIELADYTAGFSSIESVKAFKNGDDFCILVGGRSKTAGSDTLISLITIEDNNYFAPKHDVKTLVQGAAYDITDIIIAEDYIYITAQDYNASHGVVGICPLTTNGVVDVSAENWKFIGDYYTEFTTDKETGLIKASGGKTGLPPLKALASTLASEGVS